MGKPTGFMEYERVRGPERDERARARDYEEFHGHLEEEQRRLQGARCMDCGVPFCQSSFGCPVDNLIPEWNDLVYRGKWDEAFQRLLKTNNFPEYTGRVCPAPCEHACVLGINEPAVTIKDNECHIIDRAYETGLMEPRPPALRTGKRVAVVGSGPSGLAAADQLNKAGHAVTVFERDDRIGGLLMYGIPNMKLSKDLVERRNRLMAAEGVEFRPGTTVGVDVDSEELVDSYDAVLLACGATRPRDLPVPGRELPGVHFAMEFLKANTQYLLDGGGVYGADGGNGDDRGRSNGRSNGRGDATAAARNEFITAAGKNVIVIGGGDTGADCLGTALRHGARSIRNFELLPKPPAERDESMPWPTFARTYKLDYSHTEMVALYGEDPRVYEIMTREFLGTDRLEGVRTVRVKWEKQPGERPKPVEIPGSEEEWPADLVLLSMGFLGPEQELADRLGLETTERSNIAAGFEDHSTSRRGVFAA
ncbi:MAG: glutamate synthase subunit beta, partial [Spirochaetaceae bacterium]